MAVAAGWVSPHVRDKSTSQSAYSLENPVNEAEREGETTKLLYELAGRKHVLTAALRFVIA